MDDILKTVLPIFVIIFAGWAVRRKGLVSEDFLESGNRLVFYLAIPAMVFRSIAGASISGQLDLLVLGVTLGVMLFVYLASWLAAGAFGIHERLRATFIQTTIHGNISYIGFAVAFYYLGDDGLVRASLIGGFVMIFQNLLAVIVLQAHSPVESDTPTAGRLLKNILGNPIIGSALAGILVALIGIDIPVFADRVLHILGSLALPLALLIIGGSLSFHLPRGTLMPVIVAMGVKLVILPAAGLGLFVLTGASMHDFLPALILLAAPTATVSYVMARELHTICCN